MKIWWFRLIVCIGLLGVAGVLLNGVKPLLEHDISKTIIIDALAVFLILVVGYWYGHTDGREDERRWPTE